FSLTEKNPLLPAYEEVQIRIFTRFEEKKDVQDAFRSLLSELWPNESHDNRAFTIPKDFKQGNKRMRRASSSNDDRSTNNSFNTIIKDRTFVIFLRRFTSDRNMPPNPPENFESTLPTLDRNSLSKKRPNVLYNNGLVDQQPKQPIGHSRNSSIDKLDDGPRMDTNFIIRGYQQRQGPPTRKRGSIVSDHVVPLKQQTLLQPHNNGTYTTNNYNGFSVMPPTSQSINFGYQYKPNNLLGKLRQKNYEEVYKEKVIPKPSSPGLHTDNNNNTISGRVANLLVYIFGSVNVDTIRFIVYCLLWYASSAITNNSGKQILNQFRYPITLTWVQFGFVLSYCYVFANWMGLTQLKSPTKLILLETIPLSLFQILGHVFSSFATSHVPVSFVHTIKALSPLFTVLLYRFVFRVRYSSSVYVSLFPLTIGVMLACSSHSTSNFIGFLFAMGSTLIFVAQNIFSKKLLFNQDHA
ncbi:13279_t:CDS:2, partial [Ambispora leptoticha]